MIDPVLAHHDERVRAIGRRYGVMRLRVFGSRVRGTASANRDLDVLADFEGGGRRWV